MLKATILTLTAVYLLVISAICLSEELAPGLYQLETQTIMPHLEEMRHKKQFSTTCIVDAQIKQLFPIMRQPGLKDCSFQRHAEEKDATLFLLRCEGLNGAEGKAKIKTGAGRIKASLDAKLGGKNMTFAQITKATRVGNCDP